MLVMMYKLILLFVAGLFSFLHAGGIDGNAKVLTVYGLLPAQDIKPSVAEEAIKYGEKKFLENIRGLLIIMTLRTMSLFMLVKKQMRL
jgi:hypothetical protein